MGSSDGHPPSPRARRRLREPAPLAVRFALLRRMKLERARRSARRVAAAHLASAERAAIVDGVVVLTASGTVEALNARAVEITGHGVQNRGRWSDLVAQLGARAADPAAAGPLLEPLAADDVRRDIPLRLADGTFLSLTTIPRQTSGRSEGRIWYLQDVTEQRKSEQLEAALFRISDLSRSTHDLKALYAGIHQIVGELMDATNFYIALYDEKRGRLTFPYFVDEVDAAAPEGASLDGLTGWVLRNGEPLLVNPAEFERMVARGEVSDLGAPSVDWLGIPLRSGSGTYGVLGVQSYRSAIRYGEKEKEILLFVSQHVSNAIEQKRWEDALLESEDRYRQMFENNRAVKLLIDAQSGAIVDANQAACDYYGYPREELTSRLIWDINARGRDEVFAEIELAREEQRSYYVCRHRLAGGEERDVEVHSGPIQLRGRTYLYSIVYDVTERNLTELALLRSEAKYRTIFDYAPVGIFQASLDGRILTANAAAARMLGYESTWELTQRNLLRDVFVLAEQKAELLRLLEEQSSISELELLWRRSDGRPITVQINIHVVRDDSGAVARYEGFFNDVSERRRTESMLQSQATAMESSMDGIAIFNTHGQFTYVNNAFVRLYGYDSPDDFIGRRWTLAFEPAEYRRFENDIMPLLRRNGQWRGESVGRRRSSSLFPEELSLAVLEGGGFVCVVRDITERTYAEEQIKHLAYHDPLTGLPNRLLLKDRVTVALSQAQRQRREVGILFLDLDHFKVINDSLGHSVGDQLLQAVALRLQSCVRDSDTVARLGGDEFTILLPMLNSGDDALKIARKILDAIRQPFHIHGQPHEITTSIGISVYPPDGADAETLIKNADTAMYQAKEKGRDNCQLFNAVINAKALERFALEQALRRARDREEFVLHYQPICDIKSGRIYALEALVRWQHPTLGLLPPGDFIPIAEATGLMKPIGALLLKMACSQAAEWQRRGFTVLMSANLSMTQLQDPAVVSVVQEALGDSEMDPALLDLEITESAAMQNPEATIATLEELRKLGVALSLDDFGIGHSSLSYLKRFPIRTLKIDQSFIRDITSDSDTAAIVAAIIAMGHKLRLRLVAEGVETEAQRAFLIDHGCDLMQGFLFHRPQPAAQIEQILASSEGAARPFHAARTAE
jgi:diguanylate cyclase (GGDEF)-like protein/PAS domain S-box-containing protein